MSTIMKYAVYKSSAGYYCNEYHDTLDTLKGTPFETMVKEEQLPVVLDGKGGTIASKRTTIISSK